MMNTGKGGTGAQIWSPLVEALVCHSELESNTPAEMPKFFGEHPTYFHRTQFQHHHVLREDRKKVSGLRKKVPRGKPPAKSWQKGGADALGPEEALRGGDANVLGLHLGSPWGPIPGMPES